MFELRVLGPVELRHQQGEPVLPIHAQPKRLALLAYLALAPENSFRRRDVVASLFWPEQDQDHARGSLRQALSFLRRELGADTICTRGEGEVGLNAAHIQCDAAEFMKAANAGRFEQAASLYRGDVLEGLFVTDAAPEFDQWLDSERDRFRTMASKALWSAQDRLRTIGDVAGAIAAGRRAAQLAPDSEADLRRLIRLLDDTGDRAGALAVHEAFATRLSREYDTEPSAETRALIAAIKARTDPHPLPSTAAVQVAAQLQAIADQPLPAARRADAPQAASPRRRRRTGLAAVAAVGVALAVGVVVYRALRPEAHGLVTVAVFPAQTPSTDTADIVLADAITDEQIGDLAQLGTLRVFNRRTMMQAGPATPPHIDSVARALGAAVVVTSTLLRRGDSVSLDVRVARPGNRHVIWRQTFEGGPGDVLAWQQEVARSVAANANLTLTAPQRASLAAGRVHDPNAVALYARGRWWWNKRGKANLFKAIGFFDQALDVEPTNALAWSGKADAFAQIGYGGYLAPEEAFRKAEAAARRAIALDSTLAEPHAALGFSIMYYDWRWADAEREFLRAIALNPNYATAHEWYGLFLAAMGRFADAEAEGRMAEDLDPLSAAVEATHGWILHAERKETDALRILRAGVRTDSTNGIVRLYLGRVYQALGQFDSARAEYRATGPLATWIPTLAATGTVEALTNNPYAARRVLAQLDSLARAGEYVTPYATALVYASLGQPDSAFAELQRGVHDRTHWMVWLVRDSRWTAIRNDVRFGALARAVGLPR